jgi:hypothetical protein
MNESASAHYLAPATNRPIDRAMLADFRSKANEFRFIGFL